MYENVEEPLDISEISDPETAAEEFTEILREVAEGIGQKPEVEVTLAERDDSYHVYWEGGITNWVDIVAGEPILGVEPEVTGWRETDFDTFIKNSYCVGFVKE